jgi:hypothetical protein
VPQIMWDFAWQLAHPSELGHFPHAGHTWPGQQWQSNPRVPVSPASEPSSSPPTELARDAHATLEPSADQAPQLLYMNLRPLGLSPVGSVNRSQRRVRQDRGSRALVDRLCPPEHAAVT